MKGLSRKQKSYSMGIEGERQTARHLNVNGLSALWVSQKGGGYDILINDSIRAEVKTCRPMGKRRSWSANIHHNGKLNESGTDIYIIRLCEIPGTDRPVYLYFRAPLKIPTINFSVRSLLMKYGWNAQAFHVFVRSRGRIIPGFSPGHRERFRHFPLDDTDVRRNLRKHALDIIAKRLADDRLEKVFAKNDQEMTTRSALLQAAPLIKRSEHAIQATSDSKKALASFAKNVRKRRLQLGYTLLTLKEAVGVSKSQMSHIECGDNAPSWAVYVKLCEVLQVGVPPLVGERKPRKAAKSPLL